MIFLAVLAASAIFRGHLVEYPAAAILLRVADRQRIGNFLPIISFK
jgi:hypothetical protein